MKAKNYMKSQNTIGYLSIKNNPIFKKTPIKKQSHGRYSSITHKNNEITINSNYQFISKFISKKKFRGILDLNSPNNKDVLIDSDSERPSYKYLENGDIKKGCTKLVIEKVESKIPKKIEKFDNYNYQKRIFNKNNIKIFTKKNSNYIEKKLLETKHSRNNKIDFKNNNNINEFNFINKNTNITKTI